MLFVDPPRSGLRGVLEHLEETPLANRPAHVIYVSCFTASLIADLRRLASMGYALKELAGVEQFPDTPHCEWVARLELA